MSRPPRIETKLNDVRQVLKDAYPELAAIVTEGAIVVRGVFPIVFEGEVLDRFSIELQIAPSFPDSVPLLRETGGRIPRITDRHTEADGKSCPLVPEDWLRLPQENRTLLTFLDGPVRNFFIYQALTEKGEHWPWGERLHGRKGLLEAYGEMLGVADPAVIPKYLECLSHDQIKGHWLCPCGSGKKLRQCHVSQLRDLAERIPPRVAKSARMRLEVIKS